ncbi:hypothetical protein HHK36_006224 [Tetracentron sinense]|uniref:Uncharacterized protein n=1 Tax=Tetracentron sinense TaxID=13715 RepID=A0A834ZGV2_TETSI|nr:hypothetical protein HHK36_006224 [Tetracentron sinense]
MCITVQKRCFLGCGDGEERNFLSKIYKERRVIGILTESIYISSTEVLLMRLFDISAIPNMDINVVLKLPLSHKLIGADKDLSFSLASMCNTVQTRSFLGCGDGEEGNVLSKIYEERHVIGYFALNFLVNTISVGL